MSLCVTYWPSTEPSIKRCTCVNKRMNSKTGASGRRYRNITLTCGRGWIRWWCIRIGVSWRQDAGVRTSSRRRARALSDPWLSSPARTRKNCCYGQKNFGSICSSLSLSPTSHTQPTSTLSRIKCERYIFIKKCVRSFIEVVIIVDYDLYMYYVYVCGYTTCV